MKTHPLIKKWNNNIATLNGWLSLNNSFASEIMARSGFDSICIDMQHGTSDYPDLIHMLQAMNIANTTSLIRVPWLDPIHIMKSLDAGVSGIICPMINSKEDALKLVEYSYYAPKGGRSFGPIRAKFLDEKYAKNANNKILIIAMIETKQAMDNIDEILKIDDIDGIYVGPSDLALSIGCTPQFDNEEEKLLNALNFIIKKAKEHNKFVGIHCGSVVYAKKMIRLGYNFTSIGSDAIFIGQGSTKIINEFKNEKTNINTKGY